MEEGDKDRGCDEWTNSGEKDVGGLGQGPDRHRAGEVGPGEGKLASSLRANGRPAPGMTVRGPGERGDISRL